MLNSADNMYATTGAYTLMNMQYVNSGNGMTGGLVTSSSSSKSISTIDSGKPFWLW
jgi:hypothetical protein